MNFSQCISIRVFESCTLTFHGGFWSVCWARELRLHKADEEGAFRGRIKREYPCKEEVSLGQRLGDFHTCKDISGTANAKQRHILSM